jgi:hypothetical protein
MGNTCGRREADGEGGEGAGRYSGPWGLLTSFGETRNVEVTVGGYYCPGECVRRGVHGRTPARTGTTPCSRAAEPRSGSHLAAVQDRHQGREERSVDAAAEAGELGYRASYRSDKAEMKTAPALYRMECRDASKLREP